MKVNELPLPLWFLTTGRDLADVRLLHREAAIVSAARLGDFPEGMHPVAFTSEAKAQTGLLKVPVTSDGEALNIVACTSNAVRNELIQRLRGNGDIAILVDFLGMENDPMRRICALNYLG